MICHCSNSSCNLNDFGCLFDLATFLRVALYRNSVRFKFNVSLVFTFIMPRHFLLLAILGLICHLAIEQIQARAAGDCFFVDGKSLCGQDGILARQQQEQAIREQMVFFKIRIFSKINFEFY